LQHLLLHLRTINHEKKNFYIFIQTKYNKLLI